MSEMLPTKLDELIARIEKRWKCEMGEPCAHAPTGEEYVLLSETFKSEIAAVQRAWLGRLFANMLRPEPERSIGGLSLRYCSTPTSGGIAGNSICGY